MIAYLSGILRHAEPLSVIIDVNGVGYQVGITTQTQDLLGPVGSATTMHIVTQVREDAITLFGFATREEKDSFVKLTTVQGVGARMALNLLSAMSSERLWQAIINDDKKSLTAAEGVGPKLAARLTTELKDHAGKQVFPGSASGGKGVKFTAAPSFAPAKGDVTREAVSALVNLGYAQNDAARAVSIVYSQDNDIALSALITAALREVAA